jgi:hypothetical protein
MLEVISYQDWRKMDINKETDVIVITVSKAKDWSQGLSPFILGPCELWGGHVAKNVENAWQFGKAYGRHFNADGTLNKDDWIQWAQKGWRDNYAHRYPMGKGVKPLCSIWDGWRLTYIQSRKAIYLPVYLDAVKKTEAWRKLKEIHQKMLDGEIENLYLVDFDAYRHKQQGMTYRDVANDGSRSMGHAFCLAMALEDEGTLGELMAEGMKLRKGER